MERLGQSIRKAAFASCITAVAASAIFVTQQAGLAGATPRGEAHDITVVMSAEPGSPRFHDAGDDDHVRQVMSQVSSYVAEQTDGFISIAVRDVVTFYSDEHGCASPKEFNDELTATTGISRGPRHHILAWFPGEQCPLAGQATLTATRPQNYRDDGNFAWVGYDTFSADVTTHEVLHLLGVFHANSLQCSPGASAARTPDGSFTGCELHEYGDPFDVMGYDRHRNLSDVPSLSPAAHDFFGIRRDQFAQVSLAPGESHTASIGPAHVPSATRYLDVRAPNGERYLMAYYAGGRDHQVARAVSGPGAMIAYRVREAQNEPLWPQRTTGMALAQSDGVFTLGRGHTLPLWGSPLEVLVQHTGARAQVTIRPASTAGPKQSMQIPYSQARAGVPAGPSKKRALPVPLAGSHTPPPGHHPG